MFYVLYTKYVLCDWLLFCSLPNRETLAVIVSGGTGSFFLADLLRRIARLTETPVSPALIARTCVFAHARNASVLFCLAAFLSIRVFTYEYPWCSDSHTAAGWRSCVLLRTVRPLAPLPRHRRRRCRCARPLLPVRLLFLPVARSLARTASHVFFAHLSYRRVKTRGPAGEAKTDRKTRVKSSQAKRQQTTPPPKTPKLRAKRARQLASEPPY